MLRFYSLYATSDLPIGTSGEEHWDIKFPPRLARSQSFLERDERVENYSLLGPEIAVGHFI
jgi:hypothetical protein